MKHHSFMLLLGATSLFFASCNQKIENAAMSDTTRVETKTNLTSAPFGRLPDGKEVRLFTLKNANGMTMKVMNYGGVITSLTAPDKDGKFEDVVLGYDSLNGYLQKSPYFGALIGRYGNRIGKGKFSLDGKDYQLAQNNNGNALHGGPNGFDKRFWNIEEYPVTNGAALKLTYTSPDMEEGYPGTLNSQVIYHLTDNNELKIYYEATTDKPTVVNLTQHTYFNLSGNTKSDILQHELFLDADKFVPVDKTLIPTGELKDVSETPFDFKTPTAIGSRIDKKDAQLEAGLGYDHCWVLNTNGDTSKVAATLHDPASGRVMSVKTSEPGIQFYSGNFLDGTITGKYNTVYQKRYGLCLETEHFPDSPNKKNFPSVLLKPGETYRTQTIYTFSTK
ncbi:MAG TPA: aldose epimerase family protein [Chryseosolibacter sp.]